VFDTLCPNTNKNNNNKLNNGSRRKEEVKKKGTIAMAHLKAAINLLKAAFNSSFSLCFLSSVCLSAAVLFLFFIFHFLFFDFD